MELIMNSTTFVNLILEANSLAANCPDDAQTHRNELFEQHKVFAVTKALKSLCDIDITYYCEMQAYGGHTMATVLRWTRDSAMKFGDRYLCDLVRGTDLLDQYNAYLATKFVKDDGTPFMKAYFFAKRSGSTVTYNINVSWDKSYWSKLDEKRVTASHRARGRATKTKPAAKSSPATDSGFDMPHM